MHQIKFQSLIGGHHVYKTVWTLYKGETLIAQSDNGDALTRNKKIAMVLD